MNNKSEHHIIYIFVGDMMFFIVKKKSLRIVIMVLSIAVLAGAVTTHAVMQIISSVPLVIIDAGHGEPDGGCVGALGTIEQEINLSVARKIAETLEAKNIETLLTRSNSLGLWTEKSTTIRQKKVEDMNKRVEIMNKSKADLFISIHMNSYPNSSTHGIRIFYDRNHEEIKPLAENIQKRMAEITGADTSGIKPADRTLFLLKKTTMPAILIECGFLSNPVEEKKLMDSEYRSKLAWSISDAIEKHFLQTEINQK